MTELWEGFVVEDGTSPVKVWLPNKDGWFGIGEEFRGFGTNVFNTLSEEKRIEIARQCQYYHQASALSSGGEGRYDSLTGKVTVMDGCAKFEKVNSLSVDPHSGTRFTVPGTNSMYTFDQSTPGYTNHMVGLLQPQGGFQAPTHTNQPKGQFRTLEIGQRVICAFIDEGRKGVILASLPWDDNFDTALMK